MSKLSRLRAARTLADVAIMLGAAPKVLSYVLYKLPSAEKYHSFVIPKRSGGQRTISAPCERLMLIQSRLANLMQDCVEELAIDRMRVDRVAHGFTRRRSIITNARQHRHRKWVFNLDLANFFPSVNFGRVRGFLLKNLDFELAPNVATVIAQIACYENTLPQGSPCSPVFANLIAHLLDMRLLKLASDAGCTYSRYADDLTFSTNKREFPVQIAARSLVNEEIGHLWLPGDEVRKVIERSGFYVNDKKTHMMYRASRQEVTGLIVNEKISARSEYRRDVRAMVHRLVKSGAFDIWGPVQGAGVTVLDKRPGKLDELHGMLGFIDSIDVYNRKHGLGKSPKAHSSAEKTYRKFLFYKIFYAADLPVIMCEGETDNVYLTHAIRSLASEFPELAEIMPDNKIRLAIRLYKYPQSSTARLIDLKGGGSAVLAKFIGAYKKEMSAFAGPGLVNPVIVLFDNDSGAGPVRSAVSQVARPVPAGTPFVHVVKNMYVVPTPGEGTKIEDFFDESTMARKIGGKSFNAANEIDENLHYGKKVFAHQVVRPNADTIDFSRFRPLLSNIAAAIRDYKNREA